MELGKDGRGRPTVWFKWVHAVTASDVYGDVQDPDFLKSMNERGELVAAIARSWTMVAGVAVDRHVRRLGIDSSRLSRRRSPLHEST
jgi:nitrate reductase alpha subunit